MPFRVRMYCVGFGDCFLLSFGTGEQARHALIDCGSLSRNESEMEAVIADIETQSQKRLDLVVASHVHRDHINGFGIFAERFSKFDIGQVWLPWTEDSANPEVFEFERNFQSLTVLLKQYLESAKRTALVEGAISALANIVGNEGAKASLKRGFGTHAEVRYLHEGSTASLPGIPGLKVSVLAPAKDSRVLRKMNPPGSEKYLWESSPIVPGPTQLFPRFKRSPAEYEKTLKSQSRTVNANQLATAVPHPILFSDEQRLQLKDLTETSPEHLALALDSAINNTSLVLLFRFHGKEALFPGDAQWGSWLGWARRDTANSILRNVDVFKVSHHGSSNANPRLVLNKLSRGIGILLSTQGGVYSRVPKVELLSALSKIGTVMRTDEAKELFVDYVM